jgi:TRAP-type uncharacterized transport system fused permease subunit
MLNGSWPVVVYNIVITAAAIIAICGASIGFLLAPLAWPMRVGLYVAAGALFYPSTIADATGILLLVALLAIQWFNRAHTSAHPGEPRKDV